MNLFCAVLGHNKTRRTELNSDFFLRDFEDNGDSFTVWFQATTEVVVYEGCSRCNSNPGGEVWCEHTTIDHMVFDSERCAQLTIDPAQGFSEVVRGLVFAKPGEVQDGPLDILWDGYSDSVENWRNWHNQLPGLQDEQFGSLHTLTEVKLEISLKLHRSINAQIKHYLETRKGA